MSLTGVKFRAYPTLEQRQRLSQWMGCARFVWNAKCEEQEYFYRFKTKFCSVTTRVPVDQSYAQFKNQETTPWLFACPSILLRNTMCTFKETFTKFLKGECGKPKKKRKGQKEALWFTSEIFRFDGNKLYLGGQKFDLGELRFKAHRSFKTPHSLRIKREGSKYYVSFCYDEARETAGTLADTLKYLQTSCPMNVNQEGPLLEGKPVKYLFKTRRTMSLLSSTPKAFDICASRCIDIRSVDCDVSFLRLRQ